MVQRGLGLEFQIVGAESLVGGEVEWKWYKAGIMHFPKDKPLKLHTSVASLNGKVMTIKHLTLNQ